MGEKNLEKVIEQVVVVVFVRVVVAVVGFSSCKSSLAPSFVVKRRRHLVFYLVSVLVVEPIV